MELDDINGRFLKDKQFFQNGKQIKVKDNKMVDIPNTSLYSNYNMVQEEKSNLFLSEQNILNSDRKDIELKSRMRNNTYMEGRFYIFLVLFISFYALLVNFIRKGLGFISISHRLANIDGGSLTM
ncbi:conserved Plasmodium protein, unknown function [Plasmodium malariae]|uniref:Uncharacterized protein n=1 Tax=Plasmodium malariae TaxID=5858 RepID=A0A1D3JKY3_PLAMA|nr:conserved Plasmodium protein, unknown function [Plasmodium malariae]SBT87206.1 conserved Plasmodium protein, unknown function [Plasmodium malariae]